MGTIRMLKKESIFVPFCTEDDKEYRKRNVRRRLGSEFLESLPVGVTFLVTLLEDERVDPSITYPDDSRPCIEHIYSLLFEERGKEE